jgi:asparagine synthase (glutamine-hydrolysing)
MCGIAGFWGRAGADRRLLDAQALAMAGAIRHRGPDFLAAWSDPGAGIALGHARLSILDLSTAANQPLHTPDGRYSIVYNGEIYNYRSIARDLEAAGYAFRSSGDTEIIPAAVHAWGVAGAAQRFNGIFAFALWDNAERKLYLVRDHLGVKPLYYGVHGGTLLFGSTPKALFGHPGFRGEIDPTALADYLRYSYVPGPRSIFKGIAKLPPGHILTVDASLNSWLTCYWNLVDEACGGKRKLRGGTLGELAEEFEGIALDAVRQQLVSDVPIGAFLSGGIDSSLVAALMQAASPGKVKTFTIGFEDARYDESGYARDVARHIGTEHTEMLCTTREARELIPELPEFFDEPFADSSQIPTLLLARLTRRHVTVALSGDGGDELFAGYDRYYWMHSLRGAHAFLPGKLSGLLGRLAARFPRERSFPLLRRLPGDAGKWIARADRYYHLARMLGQYQDYKYLYRTTPLSVATLRDGPVLGDENESAGALDDADLRRRFPDIVDWMQLMDQKTYLVEDILQKVDRATMATGLEARVPLLDRRLVEFSWGVPQRYKIHGGRGKLLMRAVLHKYVPRHLVDRPKRGFSVPLVEWLTKDLRDWAENLFGDRVLRRDGLLDAQGVRQCWANFLSGGANHTQSTVWALLMFLAWRERHGF